MRNVLSRRIVLTLGAGTLVMTCIAIDAQQPVSPDTSLAFEVASIRPVERSVGSAAGPPVAGTVRIRAIELRRLIDYAYGIDTTWRDARSEGGPAWLDQDQFSVEARGKADMTFAEARRMMQSLLEDRFSLRTHVEQREMPVYELVLARKDGALGPGLKRSSVDCTAYSEVRRRTGRLVLAREVGPDCAFTGGGSGGGRYSLRGSAVMSDIVQQLSATPEIDRKVFDRTGLTGTFEIDFTWVPNRTGVNAAAPEDVVSIFSAAQEQLGLKFESRRRTLPIVVIDSVAPLKPN